MSNVNANTKANANANANAKAILQVYNKAYKESLEAQRGVIAKYIEGAKTNANFKKYKTTQNLQTWISSINFTFKIKLVLSKFILEMKIN
jgi:hypothetical protein